jgi:hypothetical protein
MNGDAPDQEVTGREMEKQRDPASGLREEAHREPDRVPQAMTLVQPMRIPGMPGHVPPVLLEDVPLRGSPERKLKRLAHIQQAMGLRKAGYTYEQIARALNVGTSQAYNLIRRGVQLYAGRIGEDASVVKTCMVERLDGMTLLLWARLHPPANEDSSFPVIPDETLFGSIDRLVKLDTLRSKIEGLEYAPPPSAAPEAHKARDLKAQARKDIAEQLEGATIEEKRQLLDILTACRKRREEHARLAQRGGQGGEGVPDGTAEPAVPDVC